jgi:hypothetical protein
MCGAEAAAMTGGTCLPAGDLGHSTGSSSCAGLTLPELPLHASPHTAPLPVPLWDRCQLPDHSPAHTCCHVPCDCPHPLAPGDESWLQLEANLRDQLGRLQLLLRSGSSPAAAAAVGTGGTGEGAGLGAQLSALEVALAQQEKVRVAFWHAGLVFAVGMRPDHC